MIKWLQSLRLSNRLVLGGLVLGTSAWIFIMVFGLPPFPALFPGLQKYVNQSAGFAVSYPNHWLLLESPGGTSGASAVIVTITYPRFTSPGIDVSISRSINTYASLVQVTDWGKQMRIKSLSYQEISTANLKVKSEDTILHEYTIELPKSPLVNDPTLHCLDNYRFHNGHGYILSLCTGRADFSETKPIFENIIDSFSYLN